MSDYIGTTNNKFDKLFTCAVILAGIALFAALSQPAWRGGAMLADLRSDCAKRHGVMLEHKKALGTFYECASRLDK